MPALRPSHHDKSQTILTWSLRTYTRALPIRAPNLNSLSVTSRRRYAVEARRDPAGAAKNSGSLLCMTIEKSSKIYVHLNITDIEWQYHPLRAIMILEFNS